MRRKTPTIALIVVLTFPIFAPAALGTDVSKEAERQKRPSELSVLGEKVNMAKVTGIGGVFFKSKNSKALTEWYRMNLGVSLEPWDGAIFKWGDDKAEDGGGTAWHVIEEDSDMFAPSQSGFMINYRIDSMDKMVEQLKSKGVQILKGPDSHENGRFLWVVDPDGNKIELWEPKIWDEKNKNL